MTTVAAVSSPRIAVDPRILAIIGDPAAPRARLRERVIPPASLPGKLGLLANAQLLFGLARHGAAHAAALHRRYGDILRWSYGREHMVYVYDLDTVQRILRNEDGAWSCGMGWDSFLLDRVEPEGGNSGMLVSLDFEPHRAARRVMAPAFTPRAIKGYTEIAQPLIKRAVDSWVADGRVDFKRAARSLLADVANAIFTGIESAQERARVDRGLRAAWGAAMTLVDQEWLSRDLREGRAHWRALNDSFLGLVKERAARPGTDMLSQLVLAREGGTDATFVKGFLGIMLAAYDTTAAAVTSMAYLLAKHPAWQDELRAEAGSAQLERHEWVWKETLRLMPVTGIVPRRNLRELELLGHRLPAGCMVGATIGPTGRDPRHWRDPERFDPERFARGEDKGRAGLYAPFGSGAHACIGMLLAGVEAKLLFSTLLARARLRLERNYDARHIYTPIGTVSGEVALRLEVR